MTARAAETVASLYRAKALSYLREARVWIVWAVSPSPDSVATRVEAWVRPAPRCLHGAGVSERVRVSFAGGVWTCSGHPSTVECAHRLAVRMVTGHQALAGEMTREATS